MIKISVLNTQTGIPEHLLLLLVVATVSAPGTIPAPFRVVFEWLLLFEHCERAPHPHSHGCRPLLMCSPLRRFPLLPQVGKKSWRGVPHGAGWRPWPTCGGRGCLGCLSKPGKSICAGFEASSRALWLAAWCFDPFAGPAGRRRVGLEPRPRGADAEQRSCGGAGGSTRRLGRLAELLVGFGGQQVDSGESILPFRLHYHT